MRNYEIFLIRSGEVLSGDFYPNVGRVYISDRKTAEENAKQIYPEHTFHEIANLREYDFEEASDNIPVFTLRCVKGIEEIFTDMSANGIYKAAVFTNISAIVTLSAGCGIPKYAPHELEIAPGEVILISMSAYMWQRDNAFEIVGVFAEQEPKGLTAAEQEPKEALE